ncbi:MAG: lysylphosphatidylglycerol synthase transmembrane domain-containing protein [Myxococcota bacterium]|nr:lysylphosphatidylglycerol synthase transmembrane domain-containing protein [Myxococcota bacterium]
MPHASPPSSPTEEPPSLPALGRGMVLRVGIALTVSIALLVLLFRAAEPQKLLEAFDAVWLPGLAAVLIVHGLSLVLRVYRWRGLLNASGCGPDASTPDRLVAQSALFGWLINLVLPARVGELARPAMYARGSGRPFSRVLGTSVVERVADLATVALLGLTALFLLPRESPVSIDFAELSGTGSAAGLSGDVRWEVLFLVSASAAVALGGLVLLAFLARRPETDATSQGLGGFLVRLREGFAALRSPLALVRLSGESIAIWLLEVLSVWIALESFGLPSPIELAGIHVVWVTLSVSVITLPFGLGVEQGATVLLLGLWEVGAADALALSFVLSFAALAWVVPGGLWAIFASRDRAPTP